MSAPSLTRSVTNPIQNSLFYKCEMCLIPCYYKSIYLLLIGAMGFGPGPLANRPRPTKDYNWVGPVGLACEPDLTVETQISSPIRKGVDILRISSLPLRDFI